MPNHLVFSPRYNTNLAEFGMQKPFALDRGEMVLAELQRKWGAAAAQYEEPQPISSEDILLVHTPEYLESLQKSATWLGIMEFTEDDYFPNQAQRQLPELLDDLKIKCGGTLLAARIALEYGLCANLGAGYHHAFPNRGRGFCVLNDLAIAVRRLKKEGVVRRVMLVDLDFHQGDGTALIFKDDPDTFTFSVHSQEGWPEEKQLSDFDVPIYQGEEALYLEKTQIGLARAMRMFAPDLVLYVAGSDPYEKDVLPGTAFLKLTLEQLKERDRFIIDSFADLGVPLASVFAGGYGPDVWQVHYFGTECLLERAGLLRSRETTPG